MAAHSRIQPRSIGRSPGFWTTTRTEVPRRLRGEAHPLTTVGNLPIPFATRAVRARDWIAGSSMTYRFAWLALILVFAQQSHAIETAPVPKPVEASEKR